MPRFETKINFSGYNSNETLTNFPALVVLSTNINGFSYADFVSPANGTDLRFTDTDKSKFLNFEIDNWNTNGISRVWVQIDQLASNSSIYAMWGSTNWNEIPAYSTNGAAWNSDYEAVWHLSEVVTNGATTTNAYRDSTANQRNGDQVGNSNISGPLGLAQYFDGSNDYINVPASIVSMTDLTIAAWLRIDGPTNWDAVINHDDWNAGNVHYQFPEGPTTLNYDIGNSWHVDFDSFSFNTGRWYYVVAAYDRSAGGTNGTLTLYVDGDLKQRAGGLNTTYNPSPTPGHIGSWGLDRYFKGAMDEFRILNSAPSSNWFRMAWLTAASNEQFCSYGEIQHEFAFTYYVSLTGGNVWPYTNWVDAATNIQNAVDAASDGDTVLVANGTYILNSQIDVNKSLTIKSVNGMGSARIDGNNTNRCFNLYNHFTIISGLGIINGNAGSGNGGGVLCSGTKPIISNCFFILNTAGDEGGGICYGTINNCLLLGNSAKDGGATAYSTVNNCSIIENSAIHYGGGTFHGTINNSVISENSSGEYGGGVSYGTVNNCSISQNKSKKGGGNYGGTFNNSIIYYNYAKNNQNRGVGSSYNYCCTTPDGTNGVGNISADPMLITFSQIATNSPCIGVGSSSYTSGSDIDGEPWKVPPSIGCDEVYANAVSGSLYVSISADHPFAYVGVPATLSSVINGKVSMSTWTFGDGFAQFNIANPSHTWSSPGHYNVKLLAVNNTYPAGISDSITIEVITNIHFVNINNSTPVSPYSSWETAATNIQDAVDIAWNGAVILVTNGTYLLNSQIEVDKILTIKSVNGPENTIVDGNNSVRCFLLQDYEIKISGFTITNGKANTEINGKNAGGAVFAYGFAPVITNCVITGNSADYAGGIVGGNVYNSIITANSGYLMGGGAVESALYNCVISKNLASYGGGIYVCDVYNSTISENSASMGGGIYESTVRNSLIIKNRAEGEGGGVYGSYAYIYNCTITENTANTGGGTSDSKIYNSIIYYNSAILNTNRNDGSYEYCCTTPDATNGIGNISENPMLLSFSHIATNSPCVAAGSTNYSSGVDFDGETWKNPPSIGCDEVYANAILGQLSVAISADNIFAYIDSQLTFYADIDGKTFGNIWTFDDGSAETNKFIISRSWNATGSYNIVLTAFNETYPAGISDSITVKVGTNIHFVNKNNSTPVPPYSSWESAAKNIHDAVDVANNGGKIFVNNGIYMINSSIDVYKSLKIQSVNGPKKTIVDGNNSVGCFNLHYFNTTVSGFTITNGISVFYLNSGGVSCFDTTPVITNCFISGNSASYFAGGVMNGTVNNCIISGNSANYFGGGNFGGILNNCLIKGNSASSDAGGVYYATINNCTIVENVATNAGGVYDCTIYNSIIWSNSAFNVSNNYYDCDIKYSCSFPLPTGEGNISDDPELVINPPFLKGAGGFLWGLKSTSPCRDAGTNPFAPMPIDLAGAPRIIDGIVDMGCYEYAYPPFIDITNYPVEIEYLQTTAEISGTNVNIDGKLGWTNDKNPLTTNFFPQGFSVTVNNLVIGENIISLFGTNRFYQSTPERPARSFVVCIQRKSPIEIATNALIFPSAGSELFEGDATNIIWDVEKITDYIDGTNLTITKITVHLVETTNELATATNDVSNLLGEIPWTVPHLDSKWGSANIPPGPGIRGARVQAGDSGYVLKFEVVDSSSLTNSRIFWDNEFTIVPEPGAIGAVISYILLILSIWRKLKT